jgi:hypothetical protein
MVVCLGKGFKACNALIWTLFVTKMSESLAFLGKCEAECG